MYSLPQKEPSVYSTIPGEILVPQEEDLILLLADLNG
jgi:hypothetical protein